MLITRARRTLSGLRLAPRTYVVGLLDRKRAGNAEVADAEALHKYFGPEPSSVAYGIGGRHLLLASYQAQPYAMKVEGLLARTLAKQGYRVTVLASDAAVPLAKLYYRRVHGFPIVTLTEFVSFRGADRTARTVEQLLECARSDIVAFKRMTYRDVPVGLHALATLASIEPDGRLELGADRLRRLRRLLRQSILLVDAADRMLESLAPTLVLGIEKGFVTTCETYYTALRRGIDYVQWVGCHEPESVMFKRYGLHNVRDHPFSVSDETWQKALELPWSERMRDEVMREFARGYEQGTWFQYKRLTAARTSAGAAELGHRLGLDPSRRTAVIYSHILNDANLFYGEDLFPEGYEQWLIETVRAACDNANINWVLKLHPANLFRNATIGYSGEYGEVIALRRAFGRVPEFLKLVMPDDAALPSSFFAITDWGITVRGTVGLELPCFGTPVLTAGSGRYSGKGFTIDSASPEEYLERIRRIDRIPRLDEHQQQRALIHAHLVFKLRPAKYDALAKDVYNPAGDRARGRDIALLHKTFQAASEHEQLRRIVDFLTDPNRDDFLASAPGFE